MIEGIYLVHSFKDGNDFVISEGDYYWLCSIEVQHVTAHAGHVHMKQATSIL